MALVFSGLQCYRLWIENINTVETQSLLAAMNKGVRLVSLAHIVSLDVEILTQYDGAGACEEIWLYGDVKARYGNRMKQWAAAVIAWKVTSHIRRWSC